MMISPNRTYILQSLSHLAIDKTKSKKHTKAEVSEAVASSQEVLLTTKSVFPFKLFPDSITITRREVTYTNRIFFRMAKIVSIKIEDILVVTPHVGPFFGSVEISTNFFDEHSPYRVPFLWREDALKVQRIVKGYKAAMEKGMDTSDLPKKELMELFDRLTKDGTEH